VSPRHPDVLEMLGRLRSEIGPLDLAGANLEDALAREPRLTVARQSLARVHALLGNRQRAHESLGPIPSDPEALVPYAVTRVRLSMWLGERHAQPELVRVSASLRPGERRIAEVLLTVAATGTLTAEHRAVLEYVFSNASASTQSLASWRAQVRAEVYLTSGDLDSALVALRDADANGLLDTSWLERCPIFDAIRGLPFVEAIRKSTALRAARVSDALNGLASSPPTRTFTEAQCA
jgi:hypothetical protein